MLETQSLSNIFEMLSNLGHIFRVCSECVQSVFRVCSILKSFHHLAHLVCQFLAFFLMFRKITFLSERQYFPSSIQGVSKMRAMRLEVISFIKPTDNRTHVWQLFRGVSEIINILTSFLANWLKRMPPRKSLILWILEMVLRFETPQHIEYHVQDVTECRNACGWIKYQQQGGWAATGVQRNTLWVEIEIIS